MSPSRGADCVHHWVIDEAREGKVRLYGRCKKCGAERFDFPSSFDEDRLSWGGGELRRLRMKRSEPFVWIEYD